MYVVKTIEEVRAHVSAWRKQDKTVGLVTTMGYLHEGHKSLITKSVEENRRTVVTIFVNPMQFGPTEDLDSYPRDLERDLKICEEAGARLVFIPEPEEMYKDGFVTYVDMNGLTRPIHFRGVCTVVNKFFIIVQPDRAYFGQKDAQQLAVIKRMVKDLNMNIEIIGCPIVREEDGLAMSSRNTYMDEKERKAALILSRSLLLGKKIINDGQKDPKVVVEKMKELINSEPMADIDYVEIVNNETMEAVEKIEGEILCAVAVKINNKVRLIDNFIMNVR